MYGKGPFGKAIDLETQLSLVEYVLPASTKKDYLFQLIQKYFAGTTCGSTIVNNILMEV